MSCTTSNCSKACQREEAVAGSSLVIRSGSSHNGKAHRHDRSGTIGTLSSMAFCGKFNRMIHNRPDTELDLMSDPVNILR